MDGLRHGTHRQHEDIAMINRTHALAAVLAAASWTLAPAAFAQEPDAPDSPDPMNRTSQDYNPQAAPPGQEEPATPNSPNAATAAPIADEKLDQFADAYLAVQTIQQKANEDLQIANDPEAQNQVKSTAETDMIAAVERTGLQVDEFNEIVQTMAADVNVRSRVAVKLQERTGAPQ